jgi:hypothetical protein
MEALAVIKAEAASRRAQLQKDNLVGGVRSQLHYSYRITDQLVVFRSGLTSSAASSRLCTKNRVIAKPPRNNVGAAAVKAWQPSPATMTQMTCLISQRTRFTGMNDHYGCPCVL